MQKLTSVVLFALFLTSAPGQSQMAPAAEPPASYLHDVWSTENGLPQNDVQLIQTRDGYLWLGTNGGLARFDGVRFTIFDTGNTPGLRSNRILALCEDQAGNLWIGSQNGGLTKYSQGSFTTYTTKDGLPDDNVFNLLADKRGNLWISTPKGLVRLTDGRFTVYTTRDGLADNNTFIIGLGRDDSVWLAGGESLIQFRDGRFTDYRNIKGFPSNWTLNVFSRQVAKDGSIWLATRYGLGRFDNGALTVLTTQAASSSADQRSNLVIYVYPDRQGNVRLLTANGLAHYQDGRVVLDARLPELSQMVSGSTLKSVIEDREGNLWLGTGGMGLHRFKPRQVTAYAADEGLADRGFIPITDDGEGGLWLGTLGLFHFQSGGFTASTLKVVVRSLYRDRAGTLWIGTAGNGLYQIQTGRVIMDHPLGRALANASINAISGDREGNLWVGTGGDEGQEGGLYRFKNDVTTRYSMSDGLVSNDVRFIMEDHEGALWFGATGGLSRFKDGKFINYTTAQGLSNNYVRDIYEDAEGTLWIGTYGGGLNRFKGGRFTYITTREGLFDNIVSRILEDDHGNLWMSCNHGIYRASRKDLNDLADGHTSSITSSSYGVTDGMKTNETNGGGQPAGWKARDGKLWFPTIKGVVVIDPNHLSSLPPPVVIEEVFIGKTPVNSRQGIEVHPGQGDLEIHYTGISFVAPEKVHFRYRLEGYDKVWVDAKERRVAYYTNIAPGNYTFRVMASNNDGVWSTQDAAFRITVYPPFWRTWWFISLTVLGLALGASLLYKRRIVQLQKAHRAQEAFSKQLIDSQEGERKRIAAELHDSLGQDLLIVKNRAVLGLKVLDDPAKAREQFEQIAGTASESINEVRQIAYNLRPYQLDEIGLTQALEEIVERVSNSCAIKFAVSIDHIDDLYSADAAINLYRIVQESLNNIVKHSGASTVRISIKRNAHDIEMTIEDNGKGFLSEARNHDGSRHGFGLTGLSERARMLGGKLVIDSAPGRGTTVRVRIDLHGIKGVRE